MKMKMVIVGLVLVSGAATAVPTACGDKFLLPSRGTRFQQPPRSRNPASILLYANPTSPLPRTLNRLSVSAALRRVGYRPLSVSTLEDLERALGEGAWDIVFVDLADGPAVRARVTGRATTVVLPVAAQPTSEEFAQARRQFPRVMKSPARSQAFVDAVDDAMAARAGADAKTR